VIKMALEKFKTRESVEISFRDIVFTMKRP
jgi:hypothetical protein